MGGLRFLSKLPLPFRPYTVRKNKGRMQPFFRLYAALAVIYLPTQSRSSAKVRCAVSPDFSPPLSSCSATASSTLF